LNLGGAEQLVVNAASAAVSKGHDVAIYASHHDPDHCFAETVGNGPLAPCIRCHGDWLPRQVFGALTALCAIVRMVYLAAVVAFKELGVLSTGKIGKEVAVVVDGVSVPIPLPCRWAGAAVMFYCHYPDRLLCVERGGGLKRLYRMPVDWLEGCTIGAAHKVVVNSEFTREVFQKEFPRLTCVPGGLLDLTSVRPLTAMTCAGLIPRSLDSLDHSQPALAWCPIVSLNRFERKKNIGLAIEALAHVRSMLSSAEFEALDLVIAGGYDPRVEENVQHKRELEELAAKLDVSQQVSFRANVSDAERASLLRTACCVLYTPDKEHFGIVPVEAMYAGAPVVAVASGGPLETVKHGVTGFLCQQTPEEFAQAIVAVVKDPDLVSKMGAAGHQHVQARFSLEAFAATFDATLVAMVEQQPSSGVPLLSVGLAVLLSALAVLAAAPTR
ncbi:unnamed protein product, partial [Chrysoparadoxa australica]